MSGFTPPATGWYEDPAEVALVLSAIAAEGGDPIFASAAADLLAAADDDRAVFFWEAEQKVTGRVLPSWNQGRVGSCVSFGYGRGCQDLMFLEIANGEMEMWPGKEVATEPIYGGSRVEVGGGRIRGDGSVGAWAAKWVKDWGVVLRDKYGSYDLASYDESRCRDYGRSGVPDIIEQMAREHPVTAVAQLKSGDELWAAIGAWKPVPVCSNRGFTRTLRDGFCEPSGSWAHCYTADTLIAGPTFKKIRDIKSGDTVYDHAGSRKKVTATMRRPFRGTLARLKAAGAPAVEMTEEHPVLVYRRVRREAPVAVTVGFVESADGGAWKPDASRPAYAPCWVTAGKVRPGDFLVTPGVQKQTPESPAWVKNGLYAKTLPPLTPSSEMAWMFGFLVGDASFNAGHKIQLKIARSKPWRRLIEAIQSLGVTVTMRRHPTFVEIVAYSSVLADSCRAWFLGEFGRQVPDWMFSWDTEAFMSGLSDADGCRPSENRRRLTTVSPVLAQQVRMLLIGLGYRPTHRTKAPGAGAYANGKQQHEIEWGGSKGVVYQNGGLGLLKVKSVMLLPYEGEVFNFEVEETNSYVAGGFATHNCMEFRGRFTHPTRGKSFVIQNSWGSYLKGDRYIEDVKRGRVELPEGCFATTMQVADAMIRADDSFALAGLNGWKRERIDYTP